MTTPSTLSVRSNQTTSSYGTFLMQLLSDRERFFAEVVESEGLRRKLVYAFWTLVVLLSLYGASAGAYAGPLQALSAAIKLPLLFLGTLAICFPGFYVVQVLVGSRLRLDQVLTLVLSALALAAILLATVIPVTTFFLLTGANYYFLTLLHIILVLAAGLVGMVALHEGLSFACENRGVYPRKAMTIMKVWAVLFAFVGVQMAWNLQPFVGDRGQEFKLFRHYEGNFYTAIGYSIGKLVQEDLEAGRRKPASAGAPSSDEGAIPGAPPDSSGVPTK